MNNLEELLAFAQESAKAHPDLENEIISFYTLAQDEIEEGNSVYHECELAYTSIKQLIEE